MLAAALSIHAEPPKPPVLCVENTACLPTLPGSKTGVKWYPGHYVTLDPFLYRDNLGTAKVNHFAAIQEICSIPEWQGVQIFATWGTMEGDTPGDFAPGIALVREYLDRLRPCNKKLILTVARTIFGGGASHAFPGYVQKDSRYGVTKPLEYGTGATARVWETPTADRVIAMSAALADAFDDDPAFAVYSPWNETVVSVAVGQDGYSHSKYYEQMKRATTAVKSHWKQTLLRLPANFARNGERTLEEVFSMLAPHGYAIGGPDTIPSVDIWANKIFAGASGGVDYRGQLPFISEVQVPELGGKEGTWTPKQLFDHAMYGCAKDCKGSTSSDGSIRPVWPQYFIWYRNTFQGGSAQKWSTGIRPFVEREARGRVNDGTGRLVDPANVPCPRGLSCQR